MQKCYADVIIIIAMLFSANALYSLLPILAHGQQALFPFSYPTTTATTTTTTTSSKNQTNNVINSESTTSYTFLAHDKKVVNDNDIAIDNGDDNAPDVNGNDNANINANPSRDSNISHNNATKAVVLSFYDNDIGQFTNAKQILDKYGFKGTFFIVCSWASSDSPDRMTWREITQLYREGHDIESHSTSHKVLSKLSASGLDYQVGQSKQCLQQHLGVEPTVFSPPHGRGWNNATVIDTISNTMTFLLGDLSEVLCSCTAMAGSNTRSKLIAARIPKMAH